MPSNKKNELDDLLQQAIDLYRAGKVDAAATLLQSSASRFSDSARLWGYFGFLQRERGSFKAAVSCFRNAVRAAPYSEKASLGLFFSLYRDGRSRDAIDEMLRYLQFGKPREYV